MSLYFETSCDSLIKAGEELCGDKVELARGPDGSALLVLSDGLGSGVKANILASLTSKIVASMLCAGADISDVIDTLASTLPVCSERLVAYSTFTFMRIGQDGDAHIVEFDNPELIILRDGKSIDLPRQEREVQGKLIRETRIQLRPNDFCVLFSDGVIHAGVGKLLKLGWQPKNVAIFLENAYQKEASAHSMVHLLLAACNNLYMQSPGDDTTVAVCRVRTPNVAYIMVGPPVDPQDDTRIAQELLSFEGTRIVCGGTTSQIVSRVSGQPLKAALDYISPDVPPIGHIEGVDLVTEGVITLGKTLDLMKRFEAGSIDRENALHYKRDGAHLLAQLLLNQCTGARFVVGRALNPAHQNPDMPIDLSIKLALVQEIAACLRRLGKEVEVEYH